MALSYCIQENEYIFKENGLSPKYQVFRRVYINLSHSLRTLTTHQGLHNSVVAENAWSIAKFTNKIMRICWCGRTSLLNRGSLLYDCMVQWLQGSFQSWCQNFVQNNNKHFEFQEGLCITPIVLCLPFTQNIT